MSGSASLRIGKSGFLCDKDSKLSTITTVKQNYEKISAINKNMGYYCFFCLTMVDIFKLIKDNAIAITFNKLFIIASHNSGKQNVSDNL
jgi:hypothetical protein